MRVLATIAYSLCGAAILFGLVAAFAGSQADVGPREQRSFALQGLAIAATGVVGISVIYWSTRSKSS